MSSGVTAIKRISLLDQIAAVLRKEIFTGVYQPGDKLPSERELADKFEISRLTLSKALRLIAQEGWIEISQGRNMVVKDFRTSVSLDVLPETEKSCMGTPLEAERLNAAASAMTVAG